MYSMHTSELLMLLVMRLRVLFPMYTCTPVIVIQVSSRIFVETVSVKLPQLALNCPESVSFVTADIESATHAKYLN